MNYAGIITAAGLSSRMGDFKPLLEINGLPMIAHTVLSMQNAGLNPVCVVTGHRGDEIKDALSDFDVIFAENENYANSDMLSSIKLGLERIKNSDGFFLLPGDMPLIPPQTFKAVCFTEGDYIIPTVKGKNAHPPLIKNACYDAILSFDGDGGLPRALAAFEKTYIEAGDAESNRDADFKHEFDEIATLGKKRLGLSEELCVTILKDAGTPPHIAAHCMAVGDMAHRMAKKLISCDYFLDALLCKAAGSLHDIKRLEKHHASAGADYIKSLGYDAVSDIVRCHMTSENLPEDFNEATIVFLADKLVREREFVTPDVRYAPALEKFPEESDVGSRIRKDLAFSQMLYEKYISLTGDAI
ncbi:MAG: NTP transferase domain-containing protein [Oscillospiraceae bacterium]|nr:NTP transferase domain-containing protein [Oscillospiraceae bacterium]